MALERNLSSTRNFFLSIPYNSLSSTKTPFSTSPFSLHFSSAVPKRKRLCRGLRCSVDYKDSSYNFQASHRRPSGIPWKKDLCNTVHLIGIVGVPVEIKHFPSGKVLAWTRLGVKKSATESSWINLSFWDDMAHIAHQHLEKGHQIYVCGRLVSETVGSDEGKKQIYYKVIVQQINFIERSTSSVDSYDRDFSLTSGGKFSSNGANNSISTEELWQAFFANPVDWWDNRKNKRNPKSPDFKHKDTGEALWIEGRNNPPWVKSQLALLDARMGSLHDQDEKDAYEFSSWS